MKLGCPSLKRGEQRIDTFTEINFVNLSSLSLCLSPVQCLTNVANHQKSITGKDRKSRGKSFLHNLSLERALSYYDVVIAIINDTT